MDTSIFINNLGMKKLPATWALQLLTQDQKHISQRYELLQHVPLFASIRNPSLPYA